MHDGFAGIEVSEQLSHGGDCGAIVNASRKGPDAVWIRADLLLAQADHFQARDLPHVFSDWIHGREQCHGKAAARQADGRRKRHRC